MIFQAFPCPRLSFLPPMPRSRGDLGQVIAVSWEKPQITYTCLYTYIDTYTWDMSKVFCGSEGIQPRISKQTISSYTSTAMTCNDHLTRFCGICNDHLTRYCGILTNSMSRGAKFEAKNHVHFTIILYISIILDCMMQIPRYSSLIHTHFLMLVWFVFFYKVAPKVFTWFKIPSNYI